MRSPMPSWPRTLFYALKGYTLSAAKQVLSGRMDDPHKNGQTQYIRLLQKLDSVAE